MEYKPILFNTEMVQAIQAGRKTQTRRLLRHINAYSIKTGLPGNAPPCKPGDILWVRETWHKDAGRYMYLANYSKDEKFYRNGQEVEIRWSPSIHMPKTAARIFLRVKDVRVERLQDMTEEQAEKEGCSAGRFHITCGPFGNCDEPPEDFDAVEDFQRVWDSTIKPADHDKYGWDANPWVWVIEFERCEKPERWCL